MNRGMEAPRNPPARRAWRDEAELSVAAQPKSRGSQASHFSLPNALGPLRVSSTNPSVDMSWVGPRNITIYLRGPNWPYTHDGRHFEALEDFARGNERPRLAQTLQPWLVAGVGIEIQCPSGRNRSVTAALVVGAAAANFAGRTVDVQHLGLAAGP